MNRRAALISAFALLAASPVLAQAPAPPPLFTPADEAAIKAVIDRYFAAFTAKDYAVMEKGAHAPFVIWGPEYSVIPTIEGVMERYHRVRDPLDAADYSLSRTIAIRVEPLHARVAAAHVHWERLKKDGSRLNEGAEVLMMSKVDGEWKISGNFGEDLRLFRAN